MSTTRNLSSLQFHEMARDEFESLPGTWWHGTPSGVVGSAPEVPVHIGTRRAALEALSARAGRPDPDDFGKFYTGPPSDDELESRIERGRGSNVTGSVGPIYSADPAVIGGRIVGPMSNRPTVGSPGYDRYGNPGGHKPNAYSDWVANGLANRNRTKGTTMRQGIYYSNISEDEGSISAVLPRSSFKTHEDYLVEARAAGKRIPPEALKGYTEIPGQQRLF